MTVKEELGFKLKNFILTKGIMDRNARPETTAENATIQTCLNAVSSWHFILGK